MVKKNASKKKKKSRPRNHQTDSTCAVKINHLLPQGHALPGKARYITAHFAIQREATAAWLPVPFQLLSPFSRSLSQDIFTNCDKKIKLSLSNLSAWFMACRKRRFTARGTHKRGLKYSPTLPWGKGNNTVMSVFVCECLNICTTVCAFSCVWEKK